MKAKKLSNKDTLGNNLFFTDVPLADYLIFVENPERWREACIEFWRSDRIGFDLETFSSHPHDYDGALNPSTGLIRLMSIGLPSGKVLMVDLGVKVSSNGKLTNDPEKCDRYQEFFQNLLFVKLRDRGTKIYGHNLYFDQRFMLSKYDVAMSSVRDTMLMSQILWAGLSKGFAKDISSRGLKHKPHSLLGVAERVGYGAIDKTEQRSDWGAKDLTNSQLNYSGLDALAVLEIGDRLEKQIHEEGLSFSFESEMLAAPFFAAIAHNGIPLNVSLCKQFVADYTRVAKEILAPFIAAFPNRNVVFLGESSNPGYPELNVHSPAQLKNALSGLDEAIANLSDSLFEKFFANEDSGIFSDSRLEQIGSTDSKELAPFRDIPAIASLLEYKSLFTQIAYLNKLLEVVDGNGRVHGNFIQIAPIGTGRSACRDPNLQNSANMRDSWKEAGLKPVRACFQAPPGYKFIIIDLAAAHDQIAQYLSKVPQDGRSTHLKTATAILRMRGEDISYEEVEAIYSDKDHPRFKEIKGIRALGKTVHYTELNQGSAQTIQSAFFSKPPFLQIPLEECQAMKDAWSKEAFPEIVDFQRKAIAAAQLRSVKGYPSTIPGRDYTYVRGATGRRLFIEKKNFNEWRNRYEAKSTEIISAIWLGTEADLIKRAAGLFLMWLEENHHIDCEVVNFVHDEIDVLCREDQAQECAYKLWSIVSSEFSKIIPTYEDSFDFSCIVDDLASK